MLDDSVRGGWIRSPVIMIDASAGIELHLREKGLRAGRESYGHSREPSCVVLDKLDQGFDVVSGWRRRRKDLLVTRKLPSWLANALMSVASGVRLDDYGCTLKAYRRFVFPGVHLYGEMHRFIPIYAAQRGARATEIEVTHHPRRTARPSTDWDAFPTCCSIWPWHRCCGSTAPSWV
jgi:hypothetical protein